MPINDKATSFTCPKCKETHTTLDKFFLLQYTRKNGEVSKYIKHCKSCANTYNRKYGKKIRALVKIGRQTLHDIEH